VLKGGETKVEVRIYNRCICLVRYEKQESKRTNRNKATTLFFTRSTAKRSLIGSSPYHTTCSIRYDMIRYDTRIIPPLIRKVCDTKSRFTSTIVTFILYRMIRIVNTILKSLIYRVSGLRKKIFRSKKLCIITSKDKIYFLADQTDI
jgi:hypothetical protein